MLMLGSGTNRVLVPHGLGSRGLGLGLGLLRPPTLAPSGAADALQRSRPRGSPLGPRSPGAAGPRPGPWASPPKPRPRFCASQR